MDITKLLRTIDELIESEKNHGAETKVTLTLRQCRSAILEYETVKIADIDFRISELESRLNNHAEAVRNLTNNFIDEINKYLSAIETDTIIVDTGYVDETGIPKRPKISHKEGMICPNCGEKIWKKKRGCWVKIYPDICPICHQDLKHDKRK
jgi:hypothetical protein